MLFAHFLGGVIDVKAFQDKNLKGIFQRAHTLCSGFRAFLFCDKVKKTTTFGCGFFIFKTQY